MSVVYAVVTLLSIFGTAASWAMIVVGTRSAYRHAEPGAQRLIRWYLRVVVPAIVVAVAAAIVLALTLKHYLHPSVESFFAIWMLSFFACLLPVVVYAAVYATRHRSGGPT
jgi:cytochrome bd-type quinol oxidase subunit 2